MTEVEMSIQTNCPFCELLEKVSTVADEAKKDSLANKLELRNTLHVLN